MINLWPHLFEDNKANKKFVKEQSNKHLKENFVKKMVLKDDKYKKFKDIGVDKKNGDGDE